MYSFNPFLFTYLYEKFKLHSILCISIVLYILLSSIIILNYVNNDKLIYLCILFTFLTILYYKWNNCNNKSIKLIFSDRKLVIYIIVLNIIADSIFYFTFPLFLPIPETIIFSIGLLIYSYTSFNLKQV